MDGGRADAARLVAAVELNGKEGVGGLGASVGDELGIGRVVEVGVIEVDVRKPVASRGQVSQSPAVLDDICDAIDEDEVA